MEPKQEDQSAEPTNALPDDVGAPAPASDDGVWSELEQELGCIGAYRASADQQTNPLLASLAWMNSTNLEIAARLGATVRQEMTEQPLSVEELEPFYLAIDYLIRLQKQGTQLTQMLVQVTKFEAAGVPRRPR